MTKVIRQAIGDRHDAACENKLSKGRLQRTAIGVDGVGQRDGNYG